MPEFTLTVKHRKTLEGARAELERAIQDVQTRFGAMVQRVEWAPDRNSVQLWATGGVRVDLRIDPEELHVTGDVPNLLGILGSPLLLGLRGIVQQHFPKALPR
jgi:Putative polyhydroxyalkanoic acid system protein (PHA_gran_rgn)